MQWIDIFFRQFEEETHSQKKHICCIKIIQNTYVHDVQLVFNLICVIYGAY